MCRGLGIRDAGAGAGARGRRSGAGGLWGRECEGVQGRTDRDALVLGVRRHGNWRAGAGAIPGGRAAGEAAPRRTKS